jgi:hypothetical protein
MMLGSGEGFGSRRRIDTGSLGIVAARFESAREAERFARGQPPHQDPSPRTARRPRPTRVDASIALPAVVRSACAGYRAPLLERDFPFGVVRQRFEPVLFTAGAERRSRLLAGAGGLAKRVLSGSAVPTGDARDEEGLLDELISDPGCASSSRRR